MRKHLADEQHENQPPPAVNQPPLFDAGHRHPPPIGSRPPDLSPGRAVSCPRCKRIMHLSDLIGVDDPNSVDGANVDDESKWLFTLQDDEPDYRDEWHCPQCFYGQERHSWEGNVFYCVKKMAGTWRAMMAWRRGL